MYICKPRWPWHRHVLFGITCIMWSMWYIVFLSIFLSVFLSSDICRSQKVYLYFLHLFLRHFLSHTRYDSLLVLTLSFASDSKPDLHWSSGDVYSGSVIIIWNRSIDEPTQCYKLKMTAFSFNIWDQKKWGLIFSNKVNQVCHLHHPNSNISVSKAGIQFWLPRT